MTAIQALSHRALSNYLVASKEFGIKSGGESIAKFSGPARALPSDLLVGDEEFAEDADGLHEIYIELSTSDFEDFKNNSSASIINRISDRKASVPKDSALIGLVEYTGDSLFSVEAARNFVENLPDEFNIMVTPLMSEQIDTSDLDENPESYNRFVENTETFLEAIRKSEADISVLGTLPVVPWSRIKEEDGLLDLLLTNEVSGFCVDFLDKKPTTRTRVKNWIAPFSRRLGREGLHRQSTLYAVNANRGANRPETPENPAEDFYVFGLGFDILGRRFYHSRTGWVDNGVTPFRCFERATFEHSVVDISILGEHLPEDTRFDSDHVLDLVEDREQRIRLQELIEAEQMALGYGDLRKAIHGNVGPEFIREKSGTQDSIKTRMAIVKNSFDEGASNPTISTY